MIFISHRGNTAGKEVALENTIGHIENALRLGFDVEIDIWDVCNGSIFLGHDKRQQSVHIDFLKNKRLWCHAKTITALQFMINNGIHCFWHQEDKCTLTSKGYIWVYPTMNFDEGTIAVLPEQYGLCWKNLSKCSGICSDFIKMYRDEHKLEK
jgi:hypothetical protein